jgi:1-deoxy-D-xylulose-5-phosphate reductoisomerase
MVAYTDGSMLAQLGPPDMRVPIAHALAWPARMKTPVERLDLAAIGTLDFQAPDDERFPAIALARAALDSGNGSTAVLNAANEVAVQSFLDNLIGFLDITKFVEKTLELVQASPIRTLDDFRALDTETRVVTESLVKSGS